jgi:hypothetical protein
MRGFLFKLYHQIFTNMEDLGTIIFNIPSYLLEDGTLSPTGSISQNYNNDFDSNNYSGATTGYTGMTYYAIGGSRLEEKRKYGATPFIYGTDYTTGSSLFEDGVMYSAYTFTYSGETMGSETLYYFDRADGYTMITGMTTGFTQEATFNSVLTRNEHFLGFAEQPRVYSDIFVERGKQGVMENNFRLSEITNTGELEYYGNKYFNIQKT